MLLGCSPVAPSIQKFNSFTIPVEVDQAYNRWIDLQSKVLSDAELNDFRKSGKTKLTMKSTSDLTSVPTHVHAVISSQDLEAADVAGLSLIAKPIGQDEWSFQLKSQFNDQVTSTLLNQVMQASLVVTSG